MSKTVLFLCPHAAAKSVIATALWTRAAEAMGLDVRARAAGTEPDREAAPAVVKRLAAEGIDVSAHRPRRVTAEDIAEAWRVVSIGCNVAGIAPPGTEIERWDEVPPPSEDLDRAYRSIELRVAALLEVTSAEISG